MSKQRCDKCRSKPSNGAIGGLRFCFDCFAEIAGVPRSSLRDPLDVQLVDGDKKLSIATWIPWDAIGRLQSKAAKVKS